MSFTNFYEITSADDKKSYLFGTIHSSLIDLSSIPLITQALDHSSCCIFEVDTHAASVKTDIALQEWWYKNGGENGFEQKQINTLSRQIAKRHQKEVGSLRGAIETIAEHIKGNWSPLYTMLVCSQSAMATDSKNNDPSTLDLKLQARAEQNKAQIAFLETDDEQINLAVGFDFNYQEQMAIVNFYYAKGHLTEKYLIDFHRQLLQAYINNQFTKIKELSTVTEDTPELVKNYTDKLMHHRDVNLAARLKNYLNVGNAFIAVGLIHLEGIKQILQSEGYTVKAVNELQTITQDELDKLLKKYPEEKKLPFFRTDPLRPALQKLVSNQTIISKKEIETLLASDLHLTKLFLGVEEKSKGSSNDKILLELKKHFEDQYIEQIKKHPVVMQKQTKNTEHESEEECEYSSDDWTYD